MFVCDSHPYILIFNKNSKKEASGLLITYNLCVFAPRTEGSMREASLALRPLRLGERAAPRDPLPEGRQCDLRKFHLLITKNRKKIEKVEKSIDINLNNG